MVNLPIKGDSLTCQHCDIQVKFIHSLSKVVPSELQSWNSLCGHYPQAQRNPQVRIVLMLSSLFDSWIQFLKRKHKILVYCFILIELKIKIKVGKNNKHNDCSYCRFELLPLFLSKINSKNIDVLMTN